MGTEQSGAERRGNERRWVMMRVLVEDQQSVEFSRTVNVSDSGILIERTPDLMLELDQHVNVVIQGMLADDSETGEVGEGLSGGRPMMVVRIEPERVALTFLD